MSIGCPKGQELVGDAEDLAERRGAGPDQLLVKDVSHFGAGELRVRAVVDEVEAIVGDEETTRENQWDRQIH